MNGATVVVRQLEALKATVAFGYPGGAIMPLYDALLDSRIEHVLVRHEQGAAFAASGYARATGRVGLCIGTSGPGATNLLTGVADALADSVPMVVLTGQVGSAVLGTDAFQEVDTFGLSLPVTKHSHVVRSGADLAHEVRRAFAIAAEGRPGPVWLDLPKDVLTKDAGPQTPHVVRRTRSAEPSDLEIAEAQALWESSASPVVIVGAGAANDAGGAAIAKLAIANDAAIVTTLHGIGCVPPECPNHLGLLGMHGSRAANLAVQRADLLVCLGMRFDDRATGKLAEFAPRAAVVHVDVDRAELGKLRRPTLAVLSRVRVFLERFQPKRRARPEWRSSWSQSRSTELPPCATPSGGVDPRGFLAQLTRRAGDAAVFAADVGQHQMWLAQHGRFARPRTHLSSGGLGAMGFGLPAAMGACVALADTPVYVVTGDGSFLMNVQELATVARLRQPLRIVLLDNRALGMVRQWQDAFFDGRRSQVALDDNPSFVAIARAFGVEAFEVHRAADVEAALERLVSTTVPVLCHVHIETDLGVWPLVPPGVGNEHMLEEAS